MTEVVFGEFADLIRTVGGDPLMAALPDVLRAQHPTGPALDLGAGTGIGTVALAEALPASPVIAIERDPEMRTALLTRLAARPDLRDRVTVLPGDALADPEPGPWGLALAIHLVCQLDPDQRRQLLALLADRLAPDGVAVLDRHYGVADPKPVPETVSATVRQGDCEYQRVFAATAEPDRIHARNTYRLVRGGTVLAERVVDTTVYASDEATVLAEAADAGLRHEFAGERLVLLRRA
ncbi:class I SAM-dependent methyltransferase [Actinocatenispora comari]|uniref:Methyltransferase domain-containing protein n=1 Tax=Actinocatenispora comari TaxID=2807577 RepID=A0A8J4EN69_9ACTN|nr:class I SAM-dependent methyltransferase [Actinocatenispora comari]GIL31147.1 hypothetical protein NUM_64010 [Actinocatenispora comari]